MESLNLSQDVIWRGTSSFANLSLEEVLTECSCFHQAESDTGTYSLSPWWRLQHSVETSTKSFFPNSVSTFLFRSQHVTHFTGPPFCKWQTLWWEGSGMSFTFFVANTVFFISTLSSSYLSLQSLYQPPMFGRPKVCDQWGVWCILRLQITRWVFTGQGSDGLWQRWKDLPEPVPPWSNSVQQWNKYILQGPRKLSRYVFYPGEVHSSHWSWKSVFGDHFISVVMILYTVAQLQVETVIIIVNVFIKWGWMVPSR